MNLPKLLATFFNMRALLSTLREQVGLLGRMGLYVLPGVGGAQRRPSRAVGRAVCCLSRVLACARVWPRACSREHAGRHKDIFILSYYKMFAASLAASLAVCFVAHPPKTQRGRALRFVAAFAASLAAALAASLAASWGGQQLEPSGGRASATRSRRAGGRL